MNRVNGLSGLLGVVLLPVLALAQLEVNIETARQAIQNFQLGFKNVHVRYRLRSPNVAAGAGIGGEAWIFDNSSVRVIEEIPFGRATKGENLQSLIRRELLFQPSKQFLRIEAMTHPAGERPQPVPSVSGALDWTLEASCQWSAIWLGCVWDGEQGRSLAKDSPLWASCTLALRPNNQLEARLDSETYFRFGFDSLGDKLRLNLIEMNYFDERPNGERRACCVRFPVSYHSDTGVLSQWSWIPVKDGNEVTEQTAIVSVDVIETVEAEDAPLRPRSLALENGTRVFVDVNDPAVYQYHDGEIRKVVDGQACEEIRRLLLGSAAVEAKTNLTATNSDIAVAIAGRYLGENGSNPHCGVYAFSAAAAFLGRDVKPETLIDRPGFVETMGTSIASLTHAARDEGLESMVFSGGNHDSLTLISPPALLLLGKREANCENRHWVVWLGIDDGRHKVLDLPHPVCSLDPAVLDSCWSGKLVKLSREPEPLQIPVYLAAQKWVGSLLAPLLAVVAITLLTRRSLSACVQTKFGLHLAVPLLVAVVLAMGWSAVNPRSFHRNPAAVALTDSKVPDKAQTPPIIDEIADLKKLLADGALLVDCRPAQAFEATRIPGAINFPIDSGVIQTSRFLAEYGDTQHVVTYCNNPDCSWGEQVAQRLMALEFRDVRVFRPGLAGYVRESMAE